MELHDKILRIIFAELDNPWSTEEENENLAKFKFPVHL